MDALIKRLREGLLSMGTSEDGEIDLYDIDDAYQVMDEAADALAEARAQITAKDAALREARIWLINWPNYVAKIDAALAASARETE